MSQFKHVAVLMGGWSAEREVSFLSGQACADSLERMGFRVTRVHVERDIAGVLQQIKPDAAFNMLHGGAGGDGTIQALLEVLGIPYTHSGVAASALATRKDLTKIVLRNSGVPVPGGFVASRFAAAKQHLLPPPYVIKPLSEGSSLGVFFVTDDREVPPRELAQDHWRFGDRVLCEPYIPGQELSCAVLGQKVLGVVETVLNGRFNDEAEKFAPQGSVTQLPAPIPPDVYEEVQRLTLAAYQALGCRGACRADFRYDDTAESGQLFCLEINNQPGMTNTSLVPELAAYAGISFDELVRWMIEDASLNR